MRNFRELLEGKWSEGKFISIGLDSELEKIPEAAQKEDTRSTIVAFNRAIVDATKDLVCAYKPNIAFYESHGDEGIAALRETISYILDVAIEVPVIVDAKRGDIRHTNEQYALAVFDHLRADALTVQPYAGSESLRPFLDRKEKGVIVWARSSNEGAGEFQDLSVDGEPLYRVVARHVAQSWNGNGNCGVVVGGTYPKELAEVRKIVGDIPILIPGIGAQEGSIEKILHNGLDSRGRGLIINASRSIIFASPSNDFATAARQKAEELHDAIKKVV